MAALTVALCILLSMIIDAGGAGYQRTADLTPFAGRRWQPMPLFPPGAFVVFLLGDPFREAGYMYVRFPAGYEPPLHSHKATARILVNHGTLLLRMPNRADIRESEGEHFVVQSGTVHEIACVGPDDCFCYISVDRAFDVIPFMKP